MLKSVLTNTRCVRAGIFLFLTLTGATFTFIKLQSDMDVQTPIVKAHNFIETENYYDALLALKPLLTTNEKSDAQEQALWLAHQLGEKVGIILMADENAFWGHPQTPEKDIEAWLKARDKKVQLINQLGDVLSYYEPGGCYYYHDVFLQQLIERYPNTKKRPFAEYHLIYNGFGTPRSLNLDATLKQLHDYIDKYEKTARIEVYKAYLDIAHLYHGFWAVLTYPDEPGPDGAVGNDFTSEDPEEDKKRAEAHKAEALKYYALYHINPHGLPDNEGYKRLKNNEAFGWHFVIWVGC